ncbi:cytoplasmic protein [Coprinopsis sp. MPI-PUGE-AT-0042]|nr:cytoplasmic protein [Coprinopsis sp. MPI-PUGE-AT-0042]
MGTSGESTRKRSRSPSDSDQYAASKRTNTGVPTSYDSTANNERSAEQASKKAADDDQQNATSGAPPPSAHIHMRCLIVTQDASIIIGKAGAHVNEIRDKSGARVMVSESIPGNPERILNAFGLIVRRINDEPFDVPSVPGSRAVTIKFMIPNSRMGSIQDASGARLNASEGMLPGSTEELKACLSVAGVADAIHIATYYIGNILIEANERLPASMAPPTASRRPQYTGSSYVPGPFPAYGAPPAMPQQMQTQEIYIPNALVGCIIGKGGSKINEIRHMSASQIKIMEPGTGSGGRPAPEGERLVVVTGNAPNVQMAIQLLYSLRAQQQPSADQQK